MGAVFRSYVKRFRMHRGVAGWLPGVTVPEGFEAVAWEESHLAPHAEVMAESFRSSVDARLFPNLSRFESCLELMRSIAGHADFIPGATWLVCHRGEFVAGLQALGRPGGIAIIQNLAVRPAVQGLGLGKVLLREALLGIGEIGCVEVRLEVSARNTRAVRLYHGFGFQQMKTIYRETQTDAWDYTI